MSSSKTEETATMNAQDQPGSNGLAAAPPYTPTPDPKYNSAPKTSYNSGGSPWNTSGWAFPPNTNVLDESTMPSDRAAAARAKAAEVMAALKNGQPGEADAVMGDDTQRGTQGVLPLRWLGRRISGRKDEKK